MNCYKLSVCACAHSLGFACITCAIVRIVRVRTHLSYSRRTVYVHVYDHCQVIIGQKHSWLIFPGSHAIQHVLHDQLLRAHWSKSIIGFRHTSGHGSRDHDCIRGPRKVNMGHEEPLSCRREVWQGSCRHFKQAHLAAAQSGSFPYKQAVSFWGTIAQHSQPWVHQAA